MNRSGDAGQWLIQRKHYLMQGTAMYMGVKKKQKIGRQDNDGDVDICLNTPTRTYRRKDSSHLHKEKAISDFILRLQYSPISGLCTNDSV